METIQIVWLVLLFILWSLFMNYQGFKRGYKVGGTKILNEWKKFMNGLEELEEENSGH